MAHLCATGCRGLKCFWRSPPSQKTLRAFHRRNLRANAAATRPRSSRCHECSVANCPAGGSGFLGRALARHFNALGCAVVVFTRNPSATNTSLSREVFWDGETLGDWACELETATAVVNLSGRSVDCRYATIYRHTLGPAWDESGTDFAATPEVHDAFSLEVIHAWERALSEAHTPRTRKVALRTTMVLGRARNSVFPVLRRLTRCGLGGAMGSGKQFVSWIHTEDFCRAIEFILARDELSGPVNLAAPNPLPNAEMMRLFRNVCGAPFGLPATEWTLEIGAFFLRTETELILKSRRIVSSRLRESGFKFQFGTMRAALLDLVSQSTISQ
ncbi:MAG: DUF1731 domain-containing protein [Verrucomicrobia bacterium]|nr:DUF1731 domain-containing protein [Verrucomicrobiota bacterium]